MIYCPLALRCYEKQHLILLFAKSRSVMIVMMILMALMIMMMIMIVMILFFARTSV